MNDFNRSCDATGCVTLMGQFTKAECVSQRVYEDEIVNVEGVKLRALYTPGHTDESLLNRRTSSPFTTTRPTRLSSVTRKPNMARNVLKKKRGDP